MISFIHKETEGKVYNNQHAKTNRNNRDIIQLAMIQ